MKISLAFMKCLRRKACGLQISLALGIRECLFEALRVLGVQAYLVLEERLRRKVWFLALNTCEGSFIVTCNLYQFGCHSEDLKSYSPKHLVS